MPARDCIRRPSFSAIKDFAASGNGAAQLDALLHELSICYVPQVVIKMQSLLEGVLALPITINDRSDKKIAPDTWKGGFFLTFIRIADACRTRYFFATLTGLLSASAVIATYSYLVNTFQEKTKVVETTKLPLGPRLDATKREQANLGEQIPEVGELGDMTLNTTEESSKGRGSQPISSEDEAISLVRQMVPSVRQAFLAGTGMRFLQEKQYNDCSILLRSYVDEPTHTATLGWYKVDLCNKNVEDVTVRPEEF